MSNIKSKSADKRYSLIKIPIDAIIQNKFNINITREEAIKQNYIIEESNSLLLDQIERLRGFCTNHVRELIFVEAKRNPKKESQLRKLLTNGFSYNGIHYVRFGKSSSQAKNGITVFADSRIADELMHITMLDMEIDECVISKYEAQRCLVLSTCTLIEGKLPRIVVVGEYTKTVPEQHIKYISEEDAEFIDSKTGEHRPYRRRIVNDGIRDIPLSPFDGGGCHSHEISERISKALGLDYIAIGAQIRLPFFKGYSVEFPFREYYDRRGIKTITDVFGNVHRIEDIDCIWNTSMFKGFGLFKQKYGAEGWNEYMKVIEKYSFKLGVSKYSHHIKNINIKARMNYQYLQCLNLWNPKYAEHFGKKDSKRPDILEPENAGPIINLAKYTTDLFERIIKGDKFCTCKFIGIKDTDSYSPLGKYLEAILINDAMLGDIAVRHYIYNKLRKYINEAKVGKIYADGFYHTVVGDMIGYLEYAAGLDPIGCLYAGEFFCDTIPKGPALSFRSPLICPSEVNEVMITENEMTKKWLKHFKDQDIVMINMYDISMPQQGGMDADGDSVFLCCDSLITDKKIHKTMIIDVDDKITAKSEPYTPEAIVRYELSSRDSRIGEITNTATSILNKKAAGPDGEKQYEDYISLLRVLQGKEIDFLKTGVRWHMPKNLRRHMDVLPSFLCHIYPKKKQLYHSPSPLNELCEYICSWELRQILWDKNIRDTRNLVLDNSLILENKELTSRLRRMINDYLSDVKAALDSSRKNGQKSADLRPLSALYDTELNKLCKEYCISRTVLDNYVIKVSYRTPSATKLLAWSLCGDTILENLRKNSPTQVRTVITEVPEKSCTSHEYLGKYYEMTEE